MALSREFLAALEAGDARLAVRMFREAMPHLPPPEPDQADAVMHLARTQIPEVSFRRRAYSHRWLSERGLPSHLPDELRPRAERLYPQVVSAVFIGSTSLSKAMRPIAKQVQRAMSDAVEDAYADGRRDPRFVRARMREARQREVRALLG